jgi:tRNA modification GTPase
MMMQLPGWDDTIVALATPPGVGALGVIRLSGKKAIEIANKLFVSKDISQSKAPAIHVGFLKKDGEVLDEVVLSIFKSPASYTGEDVIEFSCHGSPYIHQKIIEVCIEEGARLAKPGEYTQRAFLNGKLDLAQAEAVADLIVSNTAASHKTALEHMRGGFSTSLKSLREQLIQFSALIELELDFSQEDVEFADRTNLKNLVVEAQQHTRQLLDSFKLGNVIKHGVSVAIIGKPNSGKSTLLNVLLNEERAIVSEIAGTTRDTIEEVLNIDGILFRLIDTAGIREHATDQIETAGIERSIQKMKQADLVIYLFDVNEMQPEELKNLSTELSVQNLKFLLVGNKTDLTNEKDVREKFSVVSGIIFISAKENLHIEVLKERMLDVVLQDKVQGENVILTNARHYHTLLQVDDALSDVLSGLETKIPGDLLALDIRRCLQYLGEITGEITNDDQLDYIFSKFCIGK